MIGPFFSGSSIETINVLTPSLTASHTLVNENLNDDFNTNTWIIEVNKSQALDDLAVPVPLSKILQEQHYYLFCQLIQGTQASSWRWTLTPPTPIVTWTTEDCYTIKAPK